MSSGGGHHVLHVSVCRFDAWASLGLRLFAVRSLLEIALRCACGAALTSWSTPTARTVTDPVTKVLQSRRSRGRSGRFDDLEDQHADDGADHVPARRKARAADDHGGDTGRRKSEPELGSTAPRKPHTSPRTGRKRPSRRALDFLRPIWYSGEFCRFRVAPHRLGAVAETSPVQDEMHDHGERDEYAAVTGCDRTHRSRRRRRTGRLDLPWWHDRAVSFTTRESPWNIDRCRG